MAHYAFLDENNIVTEVIVGKNENDTSDLPEGFSNWEEWYADFRGQTCNNIIVYIRVIFNNFFIHWMF